MRERILELLRAHPDGLTAMQMKAHLAVEKPLGDTLSAMVRDHLLEKQGRGKAVRYRATTTL